MPPSNGGQGLLFRPWPGTSSLFQHKLSHWLPLPTWGMRAREQTQPAEGDLKEVGKPGWEGPCPLNAQVRENCGGGGGGAQWGTKETPFLGSTMSGQLACGHFAKDTGGEQRNA